RTCARWSRRTPLCGNLGEMSSRARWEKRTYTRRTFLTLGAGASASALVAACGGNEGAKITLSTQVATPTPFGTPTPTPTPPPPPEVLISTTTPVQGGTMLVSVVGALTSGAITFLDRVYPLTQG